MKDKRETSTPTEPEVIDELSARRAAAGQRLRERNSTRLDALAAKVRSEMDVLGIPISGEGFVGRRLNTQNEKADDESDAKES